MASAASGPIFTNHCVDTSGSTTVPQRSQCPTAWRCSAIFSRMPVLLQLLDQRLARLEPVLPRVRPGVLRHPPVFVDHRHARQRVALPHREVVRIVPGRHLHRAGPEGGVHELVGDDRELAPDHRELHPRADHVPVALVLRVHGHRGVAQHGLGPGGGDGHAGPVPHGGVLQVVELAVGLLVLHLEIRQGRPAARAPVDDVLVAVDQALPVEGHELAAHGPRQARVEREALARPVHRLAELSHLARDRRVRLLHPVPHARFERLTPKVVPRLLLERELLLDHVLRGDARVVRAGQPEDVVPQHPLPAREDVGQRVIQGVAHVQRAGDIRRRQHHAEHGLARLGLRLERPDGRPETVPAGIHVLMVEHFRQIGHEFLHVMTCTA